MKALSLKCVTRYERVWVAVMGSATLVLLIDHIGQHGTP